MTIIYALLAVGLGVAASLVQRWAMALGAAAAAALAALAAGSVPTEGLANGIEAMAFVAGMVLVAAAAARSGLLAWAARVLTGRIHRPALLLLTTFLAAVAVTTVLNLDTTAVLFTPLALAIAVGAGQSVVPFALASILGANFGSMLLPTSNLTNLVLWRSSGVSFALFANELLAVFAVVTAVTAVALLVSARPHLRPVPHRPAPEPFADPNLARVTAVVLVGLTIGFLVGLPVAPASLVAGLALLGYRRSLWTARLNAPLVVGVLALFAGAALLEQSLDVTGRLAGISPLGLAAGGALLANAGSNLAAVVVLEPLAGTAVLSKALLIGVNLGVGLTPIGSLATILWRDAMRQHGATVPWRRYFALAVPLSALFVALTPLLARV